MKHLCQNELCSCSYHCEKKYNRCCKVIDWAGLFVLQRSTMLCSSPVLGSNPTQWIKPVMPRFCCWQVAPCVHSAHGASDPLGPSGRDTRSSSDSWCWEAASPVSVDCSYCCVPADSSRHHRCAALPAKHFYWWNQDETEKEKKHPKWSIQPKN